MQYHVIHKKYSSCPIQFSFKFGSKIRPALKQSRLFLVSSWNQFGIILESLLVWNDSILGSYFQAFVME